MPQPDKVNKEATTVGDIAVYSGGGLGVNGDLDPKQTKKRNKKRKEMNKVGNSTDDTFSKLESKHMIERIIFDEYSSMIAEGADPNEIINLWDNAVKVIGLSFNYARAFMNDAVKLGDEQTIRYNMKRAKAELNRIGSLTRELDRMLVKIYQAYKQAQVEAQKGEEPGGLGVTTESRKLNEEKVEKGTIVAYEKGKYVVQPLNARDQRDWVDIDPQSLRKFRNLRSGAVVAFTRDTQQVEKGSDYEWAVIKKVIKEAAAKKK